MKYAIVKLQGHQELITPQTKEIKVDRLEAKVGEKITPPVLLVCDGDKVQIGEPTVDFPMEMEVVSEDKGEKIYVQKFHAKVRFRRRSGFRAKQTVLKLTKFGDEEIGGVKNEKAGKNVKKSEDSAVSKKPARKTKVKKVAKK